MYTYVHYRGVIEDFEWDERKRQANLAEHGIDFRDAALIFLNPVLKAEDTREDYGEQRLRALGHFGDEYYLVVYTWRGTRRRIISAWKVGEGDKKRYQEILDG